MARVRQYVRQGNLMNLFGKRLRQLRKERGYTQERLALESDCDPSHLGMIERGIKAASLRMVDRLADALHVVPIELFEFSAFRPRPDDTRSIRERFDILVRDPAARDLLSIALDNVNDYRKKRREG